MLNYGFLTSRKQRAIYLYRSDKFFRATFAVLIIFLLTQIFAVFAGGALVILGSKIGPQARENQLRNKSLVAQESQRISLIRKLETITSLKPLITTRIPAARLIRNIEEAFLTNDQVSLTELKLLNGFNHNDPNSKDDFTIIISGAIRHSDENPTIVLRNFTKSLTDDLPKNSRIDVLRNAVPERNEAFVPFDVKIRYVL